MAATDKNGRQLTVGTTVFVRGIIKEVSELDNYVQIRLTGMGTVKSPDAGFEVKFKTGDVEIAP